MEERLEVGVGLEEGVGVDNEVERRSNIPFPNLDALNTLVGTFADYHKMETVQQGRSQDFY